MDQYVDRARIAINELLDKESNTPFYHPLKEFLKGGKKVRPALLLLTYDACKGVAEDPGPAAAAIELIHTASLIHDDLIDRSYLRRGKNSFHVKYGFEMSILIADFILSLVLDIANRYSNKRVGEILANTSKRMSVGEMMEVQALKDGRALSLDRYLEILKLKTAVLFEAASSLGAVIAGKLDLEKDLGLYGLYLGVAYQIKDDLLDWGNKGELTSLLKGDEVQDLLEGIAINLAEEAVSKLDVLQDSPQKNILRDIALFSINREE